MAGRGKLIDKNGNLVESGGRARAFHECFNNYDIELQKAIENDKVTDKENKKNGEQEESGN